MAVVSPLPAIELQITPMRYTDIGTSGIIARRNEIAMEPVRRAIEDKIYIAVGREVKESKLTLLWALHNSGGKKICILHIHQPAQMIPLMGTRFAASQLEEQQVRGYREIERQNMNKLLDEYSLVCERAGVRAEILYTEMDSVEKGIVKLICEHNIRKLVMGAAADKHYSKKMMEPKSRKAIYVRLQAPVFCHIWFICRGHLIYTRQGMPEEVNVDLEPLSLQASPIPETGQSNSSRSQSISEELNDQKNHTSSCQDFRRVKSAIPLMKNSAIYSADSSEVFTPRSRLNLIRKIEEWDELSIGCPSLASHFSSCSSSEVVDDSTMIPFVTTEGSENGSESRAVHHNLESHPNSSSLSVLQEGRMNDELYDQLEHTMVEAENSRREAFEESIRRRKAEKDAIDAIDRAKASEILYNEESRRRNEVEETVAREKEKLNMIKQQLNEVREELCLAQEQKSSLESQIANSEQMVEELEEKIFSAVELLQNYKKERDELQEERDNALTEAEELRKKQAEAVSTALVPHFSSMFSFSEIEEATCNFDPALKIGEGGYGIIYRGCLRHTQVAIKMMHAHSLQGPAEYRQEVDVLSKLRHPNLVTLIGACPEAWALIYEYLPNGSLEDRLMCRDNSPPLSWRTRLRIVTELCSVLIFLHSCSQNSVVHGDLKPANILLNANYVSKLSDFGICRVLSRSEVSIKTSPKGTFLYMDPEFIATGELTPKSDVYSFGIILLRLLTGRPASGIMMEVKYALDKDNLKNLLDPTAGDWPFVQAKQLAHLAIRCCEMNQKNRPDLASEVWRVLEPMGASCGTSSFGLGSREHYQIPSYFICPIFQEVMQDPHVAADGFTYEAEAIRGWLDSGNDTSPMTNLKLENSNLVPNLAIRSAIQEWPQQQ